MQEKYDNGILKRQRKSVLGSCICSSCCLSMQLLAVAATTSRLHGIGKSVAHSKTNAVMNTIKLPMSLCRTIPKDDNPSRSERACSNLYE